MAQTYDAVNAYSGKNMRLNTAKTSANVSGKFNYGDPDSLAAVQGTIFNLTDPNQPAYVPVSAKAYNRAVSDEMAGKFNYGDPDSLAAVNGTVFQDNSALNISNMFSDAYKKIVDLFGDSNKKLVDLFGDSKKSVEQAISDLVGDTRSGLGSIGSAIRDSAQIGAQSNLDMMKLINDTTAANNAWSAEQAQINRDWQERMSNTAHQREMADLKAAGLNPVLAVSGGSGAATGSGAVAQADTSNTRLLAEVAMQAVEAAQETAKGVSRIASGMSTDSILGKLLNSNAGKRFIGNAAGTLGTMLVKSMF